VGRFCFVFGVQKDIPVSVRGSSDSFPNLLKVYEGYEALSGMSK
jgi:hypothetical protein